ncbi:MAG TPA: hypothetical protein VK797_20445 [Tepidisphaeraceae bacterium]|jgi:hypothetical protein|nr:hypothetical protein [Tepidisphaeraceae bacterium]
MKSLILGVLLVFAGGAARPDLNGHITTNDARPISGATAYVDTAGVKSGTSPFCPSCYPDCGKLAVSNAAGDFTIPSLNPELKFRLVFVADGYKPASLTNVDPAAGIPIAISLDRIPAQSDPTQTLRGRVVGPDGKPVPRAIVTPEGCQTADKRWWGSMPGVDPMAVTNDRGEFILTSDHPAIAFDVKVEARALATQRFALLPLGQPSHDLQLHEGATVIGRLMLDGKPLAGVNVGLVQADRGVEVFTGPRKLATDADGRFTFVNIAPHGQWIVYGAMEDLLTRGSIKAQTLRVGEDGTTTDAGDLSTGPAHTLRGRVLLSDGHAIPMGTRLILDRETAWDSQTVILDKAGQFTFTGLPPESISLALMMRGYRFSMANHSLDRLNLTCLIGAIDGDIDDLTILMEPGQWTGEDIKAWIDLARPKPGPVMAADEQKSRESYQRYRNLKTTRIQGVKPEPTPE